MYNKLFKTCQNGGAKHYSCSTLPRPCFGVWYISFFRPRVSFRDFFIVQWAIKEVLINFFKVWNMLHWTVNFLNQARWRTQRQIKQGCGRVAYYNYVACQRQNFRILNQYSRFLLRKIMVGTIFEILQKNEGNASWFS